MCFIWRTERQQVLSIGSDKSRYSRFTIYHFTTFWRCSTRLRRRYWPDINMFGIECSTLKKRIIIFHGLYSQMVIARRVSKSLIVLIYSIVFIITIILKNIFNFLRTKIVLLSLITLGVLKPKIWTGLLLLRFPLLILHVSVFDLL